ncbi:MAG: hypothetical protein IJ283_00115 [Oscillospiraceae bacterium]|nr:hypothetical protein [Oscillospiraceae bacterium]
MKSKAPLTLMEQIIMLLVFALSAAICLQVFAHAGEISDEIEKRGNAVTAVQNIAESLKINGGDLEKHAAFYGGTCEEDSWKMFFDSEWKPCEEENSEYYVEILKTENENPLLGTAEISARSNDGEVVFTLNTAWQEVEE